MIHVTEAWFTCGKTNSIKSFSIQIPAILRAGSSTSILEPKSNYEDDTYPMSFQNETFNSLLKMSKYTGL